MWVSDLVTNCCRKQTSELDVSRLCTTESWSVCFVIGVVPAEKDDNDDIGSRHHHVGGRLKHVAGACPCCAITKIKIVLETLVEWNEWNILGKKVLISLVVVESDVIMNVNVRIEAKWVVSNWRRLSEVRRVYWKRGRVLDADASDYW